MCLHTFLEVYVFMRIYLLLCSTMQSRLDYAAHVGGLQRAEEAREEAAVAAVRAAMEDVQRREVAEVRRRHEEALAELARKRDGQVWEVPLPNPAFCSSQLNASELCSQRH